MPSPGRRWHANGVTDEGREAVMAMRWLPCVGGAVTPSGVTEGVYAINTVKAIVRYSPTRTNRTPPPSRLTPTHLPLHAGRLTPLCFWV